MQTESGRHSRECDMRLTGKNGGQRTAGPLVYSEDTRLRRQDMDDTLVDVKYLSPG